MEIKNVFINMLKNGPLDTKIIQGFEKLIRGEFNYMQENFMFVYKCLQEAYQILGITNDRTKNE